MKREKPWLKAKTTERILDDLRISVLEGNGVFGRALAEELQTRAEQLTEHEAKELERLKQGLARIKD